MRVIAGTHKGRRLKAPTGNGLRPTSERVREALFSIVNARIRQASILDLCCGTGTIGLEAISRGASRVVFVDHDPNSVRLLRGNLKRCGNPTDTVIITEDAWKVVHHPQLLHFAPYDMIFVDPPYAQDDLERLLCPLGTEQIIGHDGIMVVEHFWKTCVPPHVGTLERVRQSRYGDTILTFFQHSLHTHANRRLSRNV